MCKCISARSSAPTDPAERAKMEEFENQVAKAKAAAKATAKAKTKKVKEYDASKLTILEPALKGWGTEARKRATEKLDKADNVLKVFAENETLKQTYTSGMATLKFRADTLRMMLKPDEKKSQQEAKDAFKAWLKSDEIKQQVEEGAKTKEPHPTLHELQTFREVEVELDIGVGRISSVETEKAEKKRLRGLVDAAMTMVTRVSEQTSRLAHCHKTFIEKTQKLEEKETQEKREEEEKTAKKEGALARMAGQAGKTPSGYAIFNFVSAFQAVTIVDLEIEQRPLNLPYIMKAEMSQEKVDKIMQSEEFTTFRQNAEQNTRFKTSGRVAQQYRQHSASLLEFIGRFLNPSRHDVLKHLSESEKAYITTPWMFLLSNRMKSRGVEFSYLPSLKYQLSGTRVVVLACYSELTEFYKSTVAPTATITYENVMDFFGSVPFNKQIHETKMKQKSKQVDLKVHTNFLTKVKVLAAKVVPGDLIVIPWGWAVAEQVLNNAENVGIRWVDMVEDGTPGVLVLLNHLCPKPAEVKANTQTGLLLKVVDAGQKALSLRGTLHPSKGAGKGKAAKAEAAEMEKAKKGEVVKRNESEKDQAEGVSKENSDTKAKEEKAEEKAKRRRTS